MPFSTDPSYVFAKMKFEAAKVYTAIDGYEFKCVYKAVRVRQDQQKYVRQNMRADLFLQHHSKAVGDIEGRLVTFCSKMNWDTNDLKKVY